MKYNTRMIAGAIQINWKTAQEVDTIPEWNRITTLLQGIWLLAFESGATGETLGDINTLQAMAYLNIDTLIDNS